MVAAATALTLTLAGNVAAAKDGNEHGQGSGLASPNSRAFGKTLTEWLGIYWRWFYSGADMAQSQVGPVQLMPLPAGELISGTGTPADPALYRGTVEISLTPGTPFVLPEFAWIGERYEGYPTVPDDLRMANSVALASGHPRLTIDDKVVMSDANKAAFYVPPTPFDPIVVYPTPSSYGSVAAVFYQGVGCVVLPLTPGRHVIHLYEPFIIPAGAYPGLPDGFGVIYDNTWVIRVAEKPEVFSIDSKPFGKSYGEWSAKWWQWALATPTNSNPMTDMTGEFAALGQHGNVWFLAGLWGGGANSAVRSMTVPANKALFFPIINELVFTTPGDPPWDQPYLDTNSVPPVQYPSLEAYYRAFAKSIIDGATGVSCTVDGWPIAGVENYRCIAPDFMLNLPEGNMFSVYGLAGGTYGPAIADGYYLMLAPLDAGEHQVRFGGGFPDGWAMDVTYRLTVKGPEPDNNH